MMNDPHAHIRSLPPEGAAASLGAARREAGDDPHAHIRSLPPASGSESGARRFRPSPLIAGTIVLHAGAAAGLAVDHTGWPWAAGGIVASHLALTAAGLWPRSALLGPNWTRLPHGAGERIALTIDDGPDPEVTPRVLDLLDLYDAHATFFCIGEAARRYPQCVESIVARGHAVENHSQHHRHHFSLFGPRALYREIKAAQQTLTEITGIRPLFFRAPAGLRNPFLEPVLCRQGLRLASWTRRGFDTRTSDAQVVARRLLNKLAGRDILLLHDGNAARDGRGRPVVLDVLPIVLRAAQQAQLRCITLRAALEHANAEVTPLANVRTTAIMQTATVLATSVPDQPMPRNDTGEAAQSDAIQ